MYFKTIVRYIEGMIEGKIKQKELLIFIHNIILDGMQHPNCDSKSTVVNRRE